MEKRQRENDKEKKRKRKKPIDEDINLRGLGRALARIGNPVVLWSTHSFLSNGMGLWGFWVRDLSKNERPILKKRWGGGKQNRLRRRRKKKGRCVVEEEVVKPVER